MSITAAMVTMTMRSITTSIIMTMRSITTSIIMTMRTATAAVDMTTASIITITTTPTRCSPLGA